MYTTVFLHYAGVINCANKLLVMLDILLEMRQHVMRGEPPSNYAAALIDSLVQLPDVLMSEPITCKKSCMTATMDFNA